MELLKGKYGLIFGVANNSSIAWSIADACHKMGATLGFTYQGPQIEKRLRPLAESINSPFIVECDVSSPVNIERVFKEWADKMPKLDFIVHAVAFSDKEELRGKYYDTSLDNFLNTMNISCYSLTAIAKEASKIMTHGGSILTLTYHGSQQVMPSYNVMGLAKAALETSVYYLANDLGESGIRVNAISAGPIKTLAASGIGDFKKMLHIHAKSSPLKRNTTQADVANSSLYLLSDLSSGVTGEIHYVDCGFSKIGISIEKEEEDA
jgi:enoyl-[acyl-carrier protein] reductase I